MTATESPLRAARLLAGVGGRSNGLLDWRAHLDLHGPLPAVGDLGALLGASGLGGCGGAGVSTALKLEGIRRGGRRPLVVVNVMEGEPASAKDHMLVARSPHLVLDGALAVASALGARRIVVCVRVGADPVARSVADALLERRDRGVSFEIQRPPARYIGGEESALASWLGRGRGLPQFRPERPAIVRAGGRPLLVHNAETLAHVALICRHGAPWFRSVGTEQAPGTMLATVTGAKGPPVVVEVPGGTPLGAVLSGAGVADAGGGVLLGGYAGTWVAPLGTGGAADPVVRAPGVVVCLPAGHCGLAEAARIAAWIAAESAGQCGPCVFGLPAIARDLALVAFGRARTADVERIWLRLGAVEGRGACRHPDGMAAMVRSALVAFAPDLDRHLSAGPCAGALRTGVAPLPAHWNEAVR